MAIYTHPNDNRAMSFSSLAVGSGNGDAAFPAANLADGYVWSRAKLTTGTGYWTWNFGAAVYPLMGSISWHNLDASLSVSWQANTSDSWGAPPFTKAITVPAVRSDGATATLWSDFTTVGGYGSPGYQYWRLNIAGTNSLPVSIGEASLWLTKRTIPYRYEFEWEEVHPQIRHVTEFKITHRYLKHVAVRTWEGETPATHAQRDALLEWNRASLTQHGPSLWVPDETSGEAWLVEMGIEGLTLPHKFTDFVPTKFQLLEVNGGRAPR